MQSWTGHETKPKVKLFYDLVIGHQYWTMDYIQLTTLECLGCRVLGSEVGFEPLTTVA